MDTTTAHQMRFVPSVPQCIKDAEETVEVLTRLRSRVGKRQSNRGLEFFEAVVYHLKRLQQLESTK